MENKRSKVVYIAGPYRADTIRETVENIRMAEKTAIEYWKLGYTVICPHMNTALFDGILPDEVWLEGALELLKRADILALTIFDYPLFDSEGTKNEIYFISDTATKINLVPVLIHILADRCYFFNVIYVQRRKFFVDRFIGYELFLNFHEVLIQQIISK